MTQDNHLPRLLRLKEVKHITGLSRSTIYERMREHKFPQAVKLGTHSVAWVETEVQAWIKATIAAREFSALPASA